MRTALGAYRCTAAAIAAASVAHRPRQIRLPLHQAREASSLSAIHRARHIASLVTLRVLFCDHQPLSESQQVIRHRLVRLPPCFVIWPRADRPWWTGGAPSATACERRRLDQYQWNSTKRLRHRSDAHLTVVSSTEGNGELIADLAAKGRRLGKAQMVGIGGMASTDQTRLFGN